MTKRDAPNHKATRIQIIGHGITAKAVKAYCLSQAYTLCDTDPDYTIMSPGIRPDRITSTGLKLAEVEFAYREWNQKAAGSRPYLIGVTGTNGKSTVATLIAQLLDCPVVGNIGDPLIKYVTQSYPVLVCELSSFQLELCEQFRPDIAVMLNIQPDHLDRHGTLAAYSAVKQRLIAHQRNTDHVVYNADDARIRALCATSNSIKHPIHTSSRITAAPVWQPGSHNTLALQLSWHVARLAGCSDDCIAARYRLFKGLPHRLAYAGMYAGVHYYNDSKATNPSAVITAIQALQPTDPACRYYRRHKRLILILAGRPKPVDHTELAACIQSHVTCVIISGEMRHVSDLRGDYYCDTLKAAVKQAHLCAEPGDCILLSPGGSSLDEFDSFEARGQAFLDYSHAT